MDPVGCAGSGRACHFELVEQGFAFEGMRNFADLYEMAMVGRKRGYTGEDVAGKKPRSGHTGSRMLWQRSRTD